MDDWLSYALIDFIPFSLQTYLRLFERYNAQFWPAIAAGAALGAWLPWLLRRPGAIGRSLGLGLLAGAWLWVAWAFLWRSYMPLNWAAGYGAVAFAFEGLLLFAVVLTPHWGELARGRGMAARVGCALVVFAIVGLPCLGLLFERSWNGLEWIGTAPDPTTLATLGAVLMVRHRLRPSLLAVPIIWCLVSGLTLLALEDPLWWPLPAAALAVIVLVLLQPSREAGRDGDPRPRPKDA